MASPSTTKLAKAGRRTLYHGLYMSSSPIVHLLQLLGPAALAQVDIVEVSMEEIKQPWYLAMNPRGVIPTYVDETGEVLMESGAIALRLLDELDTEHRLLAKTGSPERYAAMSVMFYATSHLYPPLYAVHEKVSEDVVEHSRKKCNGVLKEQVEYMLRGDRQWVVGDTMTVADLFFMYDLYGSAFAQPPMMEDSQVIKSYLARCSELPTTKAVYALDVPAPPK